MVAGRIHAEVCNRTCRLLHAECVGVKVDQLVPKLLAQQLLGPARLPRHHVQHAADALQVDICVVQIDRMITGQALRIISNLTRPLLKRGVLPGSVLSFWDSRPPPISCSPAPELGAAGVAKPPAEAPPAPAGT
jgi:hypothetical protein